MSTFFLSPTGKDTNSGTEQAPFGTFNKLNSVAKSGDTVWVRGGSYKNKVLLNGLTGVNIHAYQNEKPVVDCGGFSSGDWGFTLENCNNVHVRGLRITNYKSGVPAMFVLQNSTNNKIEMVEVDNGSGYGFKLEDGAHFNHFLNCDAHHLADANYDGSNGFQQTGCVDAHDNTFEGCRAWWISDDGFDLYSTNGKTTFKNCWSFWNGYKPGTFNDAPGGDGQGFKLGPTGDYDGTCGNGGASTKVTRIVTGCLAFENKSNGFDQNFGKTLMNIHNNTSFKNGGKGYEFGWLSMNNSIKNNISHKDDSPHRGATGTNNSWNGFTPVDSDFVSLSSAGADGPRGPNGELPVLNFLKLSSTSKLIDKGVGVGLPFNGPAPDLGAFESGGSTPPPPSNLPPVANGGADKTVTLPNSSVVLSGSGSDPDGTIVTYFWSQIGGPSTSDINSPGSPSTTIDNLVQGTYTFKLEVTDNKGAKASDTVTVTVVSTTPPPASSNVITYLPKEVIGDITVAASKITIQMRSDLAKPMYFIIYNPVTKQKTQKVVQVPFGDSTQTMNNPYTGKVLFGIIDK